MEITFIIGNGFDLNIGLKTSYNHFLEKYLDNAGKTESDNDIIKEFKSLIKEDVKNWSDIEAALGVCTEIFDRNNRSGDDFFECYENIVISLCNYLQKEQSYFNVNSLDEKACTEFVNALLQYKDGLKETEKEYIDSFERKIAGGFHFSFISFNYTSVLETIINESKKYDSLFGNRIVGNTAFKNRIDTFFYAHGSLNDTVIFGVDNSKQISCESLFDNCNDIKKKYLIKSEVDKIIGQNGDRKALDCLRNSDVIYIYGASLGETDATWWKRVFEQLEDYDNKILIIYSRELRDLKDKWLVHEHEQLRNYIKDKIVSYSEFLPQRNVREKIFVTGYDIFGSFSEIIRDKVDENRRIRKEGKLF